MTGQTRAVWLITLAFLALHLAAGALIPLIGDESYYALWSSALDWDYYDHPPMIAVMIRAGTQVLGLTPLGVRLLSLMATAAAGLLVADIARLLIGTARAQVRAVLYFNLSLVVMAVGGFATPDAPSTLFWLLSTWGALKSVTRGGTGWWLMAGFAAGLGIMSKFTNLFLGIGFVGWLVLTSEGRRNLRTPAPWLAVLAAALPVVPLILWNLALHGLGFQRQFGRIAEGALSPQHVLEYLALLVVLPTPVIAVFAVREAFAQPVNPPRALLLWSVAPLLVYFLIHAMHSSIPGNWVIPSAGAVAVLAALQAEDASLAWRRAAMTTAALLSFGSLAAVFNPWLPLGHADSPPNQTRGWPALLAQVPPDGWIATTDYALTGQLWVGLPGRAVWSVAETQRYGFRGPFPVALCQTPSILIEPANSDPALADTLFDYVKPPVNLDRVFAGQVLKSYRMYRVSGVKDKTLCPQPAP